MRIILNSSVKSIPVGKNTKKKNSLKECAFVNSALKIQCHVVKNTVPCCQKYTPTDCFFGDPTGMIKFILNFATIISIVTTN